MVEKGMYFNVTQHMLLHLAFSLAIRFIVFAEFICDKLLSFERNCATLVTVTV